MVNRVRTKRSGMMRTRAIALLVLSVACVLMLTASSAAAKEGFSLGVNVLFNEISGDITTGTTIEAGNGLGLRGGYGLNRYLAFELGLFSTDHDFTQGGVKESFDLKGGTIDAKLSFPLSGSHIEPYLQAGVGKYTIEGNGYSHDGTGGQIGIGIDIYLFPELSFNVGIMRRNITFDVDGTDTKAKVNTLDFGITYHFI